MLRKAPGCPAAVPDSSTTKVRAAGPRPGLAPVRSSVCATKADTPVREPGALGIRAGRVAKCGRLDPRRVRPRGRRPVAGAPCDRFAIVRSGRVASLREGRDSTLDA